MTAILTHGARHDALPTPGAGPIPAATASSPYVRSLAMIRDPETTLEQVAHHFACSVDYAAGILDAVLGDRYFVDGCIEWAEADERIRAEYRAGYATGEYLVGEEATADAWDEHYAFLRQQASIDPLPPLCDADVPW